MGLPEKVGISAVSSLYGERERAIFALSLSALQLLSTACSLIRHEFSVRRRNVVARRAMKARQLAVTYRLKRLVEFQHF